MNNYFKSQHFVGLATGVTLSLIAFIIYYMLVVHGQQSYIDGCRQMGNDAFQLIKYTYGELVREIKR